MSTPPLRLSSGGTTSVAALLLLQLTLRTVVVNGFGINLMQVRDEDKSQAACTLALLQKYFNSGDTLSGAVLCVSVTPYSRDIQEQLLREFNIQPDCPWTILVTHTKTNFDGQQVMQVKPQGYFLVVDNLDDEDLDETLAHWKGMLNWNPLAQFVVYLASVEETDEEMTDLMVEILLSFMNNHLYNVNVIGQSDENSFYSGKTVFPYHPDNNCGNRVIAVEFLDSCSYEEAEEDDDSSSELDNEDTNFEDEIENEFIQDNGEAESEYGNNDDGPTENRENENSATTVEEAEYVNEVEPADENADEYNDTTIVDMNSHATARALGLTTNENSSFKMDSQENEGTNKTSKSDQPEIKVKEYVRARFEDKFPRDLSGCPIRAGYRGPWEPYIFPISQAPLVGPAYYETGGAGNETAPSYDYNDEMQEDYNNAEDEMPNTNQVDESVGLSTLTGIEYQLTQTIAQRLHVSIDFTTKSSNVFHLFQQLIEGKIEMIVGGIDEDPKISQFVSSSTPYHQDELTWCVAKAKRQHSLFNFLASFDAVAWLLLLLTIVVNSLGVVMVQHISGFKLKSVRNYLSICIRMLGILVTQAINVNAQAMPNALRLLLLMAFILAFFFSNTYQSVLISTLTTPTTQAQISELEEIYSERMRILISSENVRHLSKEGETFKYIRENFEVCVNIVECLNNAADQENVVVSVSRQHAFYNARIQRDRLYCFDRKESLYVYQVSMLLPKKYHLLHHINAVIQHVIESGHMQKWARDLDMVRMIQEKITGVQEDAFKALTLGAFHGAFAFASVLTLLAGGVFILECVVYLLVVKWRTRLRVLRCIHRRFGRF
ncbi:uncharacterized protein LOC6564310 [Drosophila grimshawi]|uniref:GH19044 n=1 Tax=Drosophila grimshawi TaxID=7222 RepID=B4JI78_DROGR|nr:uncharacterized protein LOC6564310 [Drosophila grimshawi]EDV92959.1 GH19044 [Drosophila grimshawi]